MLGFYTSFLVRPIELLLLRLDPIMYFSLCTHIQYIILEYVLQITNSYIHTYIQLWFYIIIPYLYLYPYLYLHLFIYIYMCVCVYISSILALPRSPSPVPPSAAVLSAASCAACAACSAAAPPADAAAAPPGRRTRSFGGRSKGGPVLGCPEIWKRWCADVLVLSGDFLMKLWWSDYRQCGLLWFIAMLWLSCGCLLLDGCFMFCGYFMGIWHGIWYGMYSQPCGFGLFYQPGAFSGGDWSAIIG